MSVSIKFDDGKLVLEISDDGVGFNLETAEMGRGFGLADIKDRAERLGGMLTVDTSPGSGARLNIRVPMAQSVAGSVFNAGDRS